MRRLRGNAGGLPRQPPPHRRQTPAATPSPAASIDRDPDAPASVGWVTSVSYKLLSVAPGVRSLGQKRVRRNQNPEVRRFRRTLSFPRTRRRPEMRLKHHIIHERIPRFVRFLTFPPPFLPSFPRSHP